MTSAPSASSAPAHRDRCELSNPPTTEKPTWEAHPIRTPRRPNILINSLRFSQRLRVSAVNCTPLNSPRLRASASNPYPQPTTEPRCA